MQQTSRKALDGQIVVAENPPSTTIFWPVTNDDARGADIGGQKAEPLTKQQVQPDPEEHAQPDDQRDPQPRIGEHLPDERPGDAGPQSPETLCFLLGRV